ncbi:uncharacterized protein LOC133174675 [Saccostrea echinata]|uniref:uncharacterized protein LOC133174675 n=1 Tax=Saccostrea echinata TaxID=191078 RepID=UPI002A7F77C3|nr:uncharacterized protein LOC133174675 [Saccostrea echinata]
MASGNYTTPPYYPFDTRFPSQPIYTVTAGNDIGRLENHMAMVQEPTRVRKKRSPCWTTVTTLSVLLNVILAAGIVWCILSYFGNNEKDLNSNEHISDGYSPSPTSALKLKSQGNPCEILTSSAVCMPCQGLHSELLWREILIKVRAGKTDLCCKKLEDSKKRLIKEIRDVHKMTKANLRGTPNKAAALSQFYYVHKDHIGADLGRMPLKDPKASPYFTTLKVKEFGAYKIFAGITMTANKTTCIPSKGYFIRVVAEHPDRSPTYLLRKDWKCPRGLSFNTQYLNPVEVEETFYLSKGTILYVEVFNRLQVYRYHDSDYVGLVKI